MLDAQARLLSALKEGRLRFAYQPVVCVKTGLIYKYECLLRIVDNGKLISAGPLIEASEKTGGMSELDIFVLRQAIKDLQLRPAIVLSINISNSMLSNQQWLEVAKDIAQDRSLAERLVVEITETGCLQNLQEITTFASKVRSYGFRVALDDFGAGIFRPRENLITQLQTMNIDIIKIDGRYVRNILADAASESFIADVVQFAKQNDIKTIAEFVETGEVAEALREIGVDYLQGHYFSPAMQELPD